MFGFIPRAILTIGFVWVMFPHQPDLGLGRPTAIATMISDASANGCASQCDATGIEKSRNALFDTLARVRGDLNANGTKLGTLSRNGAF